jgi:hypothetical protein
MMAGGKPLLLDLYPNAAAAYSLRKLRTAYTGSAIRVRRSSDNTEQDIGFDSNNNLDTTALTTFCGAGNGFVTTFYDQSGLNLNLTQTSATAQPQIFASGSTILINNLPSLKFDGSNDFLNGGNILNIGTNSFTAFSFVSANAGNGTIYAKSLATVGGDRYALFHQTGNLYSWLITTGTETASTLYPTPFKRLLTTQIIRGTSNTLFADGSQIAINSSVSNYAISSSTRFLMGAYNNATDTGIILPLNGNISEIVIYLSNQSSNRTAIESNIKTYYGIP